MSKPCENTTRTVLEATITATTLLAIGYTLLLLVFCL